MKNFYELTFREEQEQKEFILKTLCQNPYIYIYIYIYIYKYIYLVFKN